MKTKITRYLALGLGIAFLTPNLWAQKGDDDPYLDDAYRTRQEVETRSAKLKAEAETRAKAREAARIEAEKTLAEERAKYLALYKQKMKEREIDAYNGHLSPEDSAQMAQIYQEEYERAKREMSQRKGSGLVRIYGPYSSRLNRFYSDNAVVVYNPESVYIEEGLGYGTTNVYINTGSWGNSYYPWYDSWYDNYYFARPWDRYYGYYSPSWSWHMSIGWGYPYYGGWGGYYDPWYSPYHYSHYYGFPYYGGYWGGYYDGYYSRAYRNSIHRDGARSSSYTGRYYTPSSTAYGALETIRTSQSSQPAWRTESSTSNPAYRGRSRSSYTGHSGDYQQNPSRHYDSQSRSTYQGSSSSSSYGGGSRSSQSSGSGGGFRSRR